MKISSPSNNRLFYKKWIYRVRCHVKHAPIMHTVVKYGFKYLIDRQHRPNSEFELDAVIIKKFAEYASEFFEDHENYKIRAEGSHVNIFCNDISRLDIIDAKLRPWIVDVTGPSSSNDVEFLLQNNRKILCNAFPHRKYSYKIFINNRMIAENRESFFEWVSKYPLDQLRVSKKTYLWLAGKVHWNYAPFMYVIDGPMASMVAMQLGTDISSIEEFILKQQINTPLGQPHHASIELTI